MKYFIVMNEWNYPNESGREFVETYDTIDEAYKSIQNQFNYEYNNFLDTIKGKEYSISVGKITTSPEGKPCDFIGYVLCSEDGIYYLSKMIEVND